ncbi:MAG: hypothetical protein KC444_09760 [Nitrosopumilus sp.]|nr:hypothetical protein [Nitrosopumilus sp.]
MGFDTSSANTKPNPTKQELQSGTILKVINDNFSKKDIEFLWQKHNDLLKEADQPSEKYTRTVAELIKELRDVSEKLIEAGAIAGFESRKDVASYVWKQLKDRNIPYAKPNFYRYFSDEQKRDYQTPAFLEKTPEKSHKHDFSIVVGNYENVGEIRKCMANGDVLCQAKMIDGQVYENVPDEDSDRDLTRTPKKDPIFYEDENQYFLATLEKEIKALNSIHRYYKNNPAFSMLSDDEKHKIREDLLLLEKSIEFLINAYNDKTKIPKFAQYLLVESYTSTNNWAGGVYLQSLRKFGADKVLTSKEELSKLITPKQTGRSMSGRTTEQHPRYDPKTSEEAMMMNFYGVKCSNKECKSFGYRVDYDQVQTEPAVRAEDGSIITPAKWDTQLVCLVCRTIQKPKTFPLPNVKRKVTMDWES